MKILVCDDHAVFREGFTLLLKEMGMDVVGAAASGEELLDLAHTNAVDVFVVDLHLPGISGIEAIRRLLRDDPGRRVLVLSMVADDVALFSALRAGATGYLLKGAHSADVHRALEAVMEGSLFVDAPLARQLVHGLSSSEGIFPQLTSRERDILIELCHGRSTDAIAASYFLTTKTVRNNVSNIIAKLGVATRAEAVAKAHTAGFDAPG
ncbi:response regulator transcription factor [Arthrobacter sp. H35-D1]|uniref:response regulator transcription factor n=1 Tax=Arthrobacter sp. H35-D1 TaxID=3046202 RepID=UPI0024BBE4B3|nr:response regulator transcription factor [Arthrobacter sp. H35-D1]MDJ0313501.1 response regulator transcription factor [Arthrobacter sp. H35-D1]